MKIILFSPTLSSFRSFSCVSSFCSLLILAASAQAQTWTWDGGGSSNGWNRAANWLGDTVPTSGIDTSIIFGTGPQFSITQNIQSPFILNQLTLASDANAFNLHGSSVEFRTSSGGVAPGIVMNSAADQQINLDLVLTNNLTVSGSGTGALNLDAAISGLGSFTQTYTGAVNLTKTASHTGGTIINAGVFNVNTGGKLNGGGALQIADDATMGQTAGTVQVSSVTGAGSLTISGGTFTASGAISGSNGSRISQTGGNVQVTALNLNTNGSSGAYYTLSGTDSTLSIVGQLNLSQTGRFIQNDGQFSAGSLALTGSGSRITSFTQNGGSLTTGAVTAYGVTWSQTGGTFAATGLGSSTVNGSTTTVNFSGGSQTYTNDFSIASAGSLNYRLSGTAALTVGGTVQFSGDNAAAVSQSGGTLSANAIVLTSLRDSVASYTLSGGSLTTGSFSLNKLGAQFTQSGGTATVGDFNFNAESTANLNGGLLKVNRIQGPSGSTAGTLSLNGGTLEARQDNAAFIAGLANVYVQDGGARIDSGSFNIETAQALTHGTGAAIDGGLTKLGAGKLTVTGSNTYTGTTTISNGTLQIGNGGSTGSLGSGDMVNESTLLINRSGLLEMGNTISGAGTLTQLGSGTTVLSQDNTYMGTTTISNGVLQIGNGGTTGTAGSGNLVNNATLQFNRSGTVAIANAISGTGGVNFTGGAIYAANGEATYTGATTITGGRVRFNSGSLSGVISGAGSVEKFGSGTLTLSAVNTFTGGLILSGGTVNAASDASLGSNSNPLTFLNGTLQFTGNTTTSRNLNLGSAILNAASGTTTTYDGAALSGGFLGGAGTHALGNGTSLQGTTTLAGSKVTQTGGNASLTAATVRGTLTQSSGANLVLSQSTVGTQATVNTTGAIDASGTDSYGQINIRSGGSMVTSTLSLGLGGGSRTTVQAGGSLRATNGGAIELSGLLTNNGAQTGALNVNYGGTAKGAGTFGTVAVAEGGAFSPGNSPGTATVESMSFGDGGNYVFELNSTAVGPGTNQDFLDVVGNLNFNLGTGEKFKISLVTLNGSNNAAALSDFNSSQNYSFALAFADSINGFSPSQLQIDTTGFLNGLNGGSFSLVQQGQFLNLEFTAVPEPSTYALMGLGLVGIFAARRFFRA